MPGKDASPKETWLDWLPEGVAPPPEDTWIPRAELLADLADQGVVVSPRTLGHWETQGFLPRPVRRWRGTSAPALYPPFAANLVRAVASGALRKRNLDNFAAELMAWKARQVSNQWNSVRWFYTDDRGQKIGDMLADIYEETYGVRPRGGVITLLGPHGERLESVAFETDAPPRRPAGSS